MSSGCLPLFLGPKADFDVRADPGSLLYAISTFAGGSPRGAAFIFFLKFG